MRDKKELPIREPSRRGPRVAQDDEERIPRHKSKVTGPQDDRIRESPQSRHRSMAIHPYERARDRDSISYYQGRSGHGKKPVLMSPEEAQKAIRTLLMQVKETIPFFASFAEDYQRETRGIEAYADPEILIELWRCKIEGSNSKGRSSKRHSKDDGSGSRSRFDEFSDRLWDSLHDAYLGARAHPSGQTASMARKLETAKMDVGKLLAVVQTDFREVDALINDLRLLQLALELGGAGTASHDDRAKPRSRAHAAGNGHQRDSNQEREDARYGGEGEDSGIEDNDQRDEQYGEHSERPGGREDMGVGSDGEGRGPFPTDQTF